MIATIKRDIKTGRQYLQVSGSQAPYQNIQIPFALPIISFLNLHSDSMFTQRLTASSPLVLLAITSVAYADTPTIPGSNSANTNIVVVSGKRTDVINEVDRKVYRTSADLQATTGSAADILGNIPSVEVDMDGNVSLRGDPGVTVLVDGKPSGQMQGKSRGAALQSFSAADIQQVEIITSPSAEFKPDGSGGIINIVTRKNRKTGHSAIFLANIGNDGRRNMNVSSSYNTDHFNLDGGFDLRADSRERIRDNETSSVGSGTASTASSHQTESETKNRKAARTGLKYTPDDKQTVGLSVDYSNREERRSNSEYTLGSSAANIYNRFTHGGGPHTEANVALSFEQKLGHKGESVSFYLQSSDSNETNVFDITTLDPRSGVVSSLEQDFGEEIFNVSKFTTAYVRPFDSGAKLKLGYDIQLDRTGFNDTRSNASAAFAPLIVDHAFDNRFRYRQNVNAVYTTYGKKSDKLELLGGLRFEQVDIHTRQNVSGDTSMQSYGKLYPTLNALYTLSETDTLTAGFSKRVRKPDPDDLNPYINASDPNNLRQGNPNLKPQITNSFEVGYRHDTNGQSTSLTGYYRKSYNGDTEVLTQISGDVVLITKANLPANQSGGVEFTTSGKLLPKLGYNVSGNAFYNQIKAQSLGVADGTRSNVAVNTKATLNWQQTATDKCQVSANYRGKRLTPQGYNLPVATMNIGYRHQWNSDVALVATVSDMFNSQRERRVYQTPTFNGTYRRHQTGQVAYMGLSYTFGGSKKARDTDFNYE